MTMPIEATEQTGPLVIWRKELRPDSGGAGRMRGGLGQILEISAREGFEFDFSAMFDRCHHPARGRDGGQDGGPGVVRLDDGTAAPPQGLAARARGPDPDPRGRRRRGLWPGTGARPRSRRPMTSRMATSPTTSPTGRTDMPRFNRLLITGAAGNLGTLLRAGLAPLATTLRLTDRAEITDPQPHEEVVMAELADFDAVMAAVEGCDAVVHFGAAPMEKPWAEILNSSIIGGYNLYEAARRHGIRRIVYASSIHAVGYVRREDGADTDTEHRPDSLYGVSKCFMEDLAKLYFDKFRIETAALRINSCFPEPADRRHLATWMSFRDCVQLVERCLTAERIGFSVIYGISDNRERFFSNDKVRHIGYMPRDSAGGVSREGRGEYGPGRAVPAVDRVCRRRLLRLGASG